MLQAPPLMMESLVKCGCNITKNVCASTCPFSNEGEPSLIFRKSFGILERQPPQRKVAQK